MIVDYPSFSSLHLILSFFTNTNKLTNDYVNFILHCPVRCFHFILYAIYNCIKLALIYNNDLVNVGYIEAGNFIVNLLKHYEDLLLY